MYLKMGTTHIPCAACKVLVKVVLLSVVEELSTAIKGKIGVLDSASDSNIVFGAVCVTCFVAISRAQSNLKTVWI